MVMHEHIPQQPKTLPKEPEQLEMNLGEEIAPRHTELISAFQRLKVQREKGDRTHGVSGMELIELVGFVKSNPDDANDMFGEAGVKMIEEEMKKRKEHEDEENHSEGQGSGGRY